MLIVLVMLFGDRLFIAGELVKVTADCLMARQTDDGGCLLCGSYVG